MVSEKAKTVVLAIGGNSLIADPKHKTVEDQFATAFETSQHIAELIRAGNRVVITHGNGPQVGFILRRSDLSRGELHPVPLDSCGADTQGAIGYHIQRAMANVMKDWEEKKPVATVVTQVLVDRNDEAFKKPSKPIGTFMDEATAKKRQQEEGWQVVEDAGRGFRRVVASPRPKDIIEFPAIQHLINNGFVVVSVGGGGIPVVYNEDGTLKGVDAVIDKDLASSLLARELHADYLVISTAVEKAYLNFGKPDQKALDKMDVQQAKTYLAEGHFAPGSMKPKIEAMLEFVEAGGAAAILTDPAHLGSALDGKTGTWIVP